MKHISEYTSMHNSFPRRTRSAPSYNPDFDRYEREKQSWIAEHPEATPEQYQTAMLTIASRCGI